MKKILLMIVGAFLLSTSLFAKEVVPFTVMATGNTFKAPVGAILNIESGEIY